MPRKIHKSLQDYLSKLKKPTPNIQLAASNALSSSFNRILLGCKHHRTLSLDIDGDQSNSHGSSSDHGLAATLSDVDRFLFENFSSLYQENDDDDHDTKNRKEVRQEEEEEEEEEDDEEKPRMMDPPLMNILSSPRFFATPGSSSSLMEDARGSLTASSEEISSSYTTSSNSFVDFSLSSCSEIKEASPSHCCIAVLMNSSNPYADFRGSMQKMMEARLRRHERVDWDFMEDLLFCYFNLNDKDSHKHILQAFVDLIHGLRRNTNQ